MLCHGPGPQHEATGVDHFGNAWCPACWKARNERVNDLLDGYGLHLAPGAERTADRLEANLQRFKEYKRRA